MRLLFRCPPPPHGGGGHRCPVSVRVSFFRRDKARAPSNSLLELASSLGEEENIIGWASSRTGNLFEFPSQQELGDLKPGINLLESQQAKPLPDA